MTSSEWKNCDRNLKSEADKVDALFDEILNISALCLSKKNIIVELEKEAE